MSLVINWALSNKESYFAGLFQLLEFNLAGLFQKLNTDPYV
jgi:hypothetical protein